MSFLHKWSIKVTWKKFNNIHYIISILDIHFYFGIENAESLVYMGLFK
jgi:hypothetical protein